MQKQANPYIKNRGMIFFVLRTIKVLLIEILGKKHVDAKVDNKFPRNENRNDLIRAVKKQKKHSKPLRIVTNHMDTVSTVEVRSGRLHIRLVPLSTEEQQRKRVKGYKYLSV